MQREMRRAETLRVFRSTFPFLPPDRAERRLPARREDEGRLFFPRGGSGFRRARGLAATDRDPAARGVGAFDLDEIMRGVGFVLGEKWIRLSGFGANLARVRLLPDRLQGGAPFAGDKKALERHVGRRFGYRECACAQGGENECPDHHFLENRG